MEEGYLKLFRCILSSQVFAHQTALKIWIWCLCKASFKERFIPLKIGRGEITVKVLPSQFIFGRFKAEEELNIDGSTIYKWIQKFASSEFEKMIIIESNNQYSIITICNWEQYQVLENSQGTAKEQPRNNQVTPKEQPHNTNNKDLKGINYLKDNNGKKEPEKILVLPEPDFIDPIIHDRLNKPFITQNPGDMPPAVSEPRQIFTPPTLEKVAAYCKERNNDISAQAFIDHYTTVGWRYGKGPGKPIKDWKACVRTWEDRMKKEVQEKGIERGQHPGQNFVSGNVKTEWRKE